MPLGFNLNRKPRHRPKNERGTPYVSNTQLLMQAANTLAQPFTIEELTVACWRLAPERFSMFQHPYPDNNKVIAILSHRNGPVRGGQLVKVARGMFRVNSVREAVA